MKNKIITLSKVLLFSISLAGINIPMQAAGIRRPIRLGIFHRTDPFGITGMFKPFRFDPFFDGIPFFSPPERKIKIISIQTPSGSFEIIIEQIGSKKRIIGIREIISQGSSVQIDPVDETEEDESTEEESTDTQHKKQTPPIRLHEAFRLRGGAHHANPFAMPGLEKNKEVDEKADSVVTEYKPKPGEKQVTFDDVIGQPEAVKALKRLKRLHDNPKKRVALKIKMPTGILLYGPPGTGKTFCALATANELNVPFFSMNASQVPSKWVGEGQKILKAGFDKVRKAGKEKGLAILFIDEIDAIATKRNGSEHDSSRQIKDALLNELGGFESSNNIIVICATNTAEQLDPAIIRSGRMDTKIEFYYPDHKARKDLLKHYLSLRPVDQDILDDDFINLIANKCASGVVGAEFGIRTPFTGADINELVNKAANCAFDAKDERLRISQDDILKAVAEMTIGQERHEEETDEEREYKANHEAGHAISADELGKTINEITIQSRGGAGGYTAPDPYRGVWTLKKYLEEICVLYGGECAEAIKFGGEENISRGAAGDEEIIDRYAAAAAIWPKRADRDPREKVMSEAARNKLEQKIEKIKKACKEKTYRILQKRRADLDSVANKLIKKTTLSGKEFEALIER